MGVKRQSGGLVVREEPGGNKRFEKGGQKFPELSNARGKRRVAPQRWGKTKRGLGKRRGGGGETRNEKTARGATELKNAI